MTGRDPVIADDLDGGGPFIAIFSPLRSFVVLNLPLAISDFAISNSFTPEPGCEDALSATTRSLMPSATALYRPADTDPAPTSSWPAPSGATEVPFLLGDKNRHVAERVDDADRHGRRCRSGRGRGPRDDCGDEGDDEDGARAPERMRHAVTASAGLRLRRPSRSIRGSTSSRRIGVSLT